jgi:hypothetical protein
VNETPLLQNMLAENSKNGLLFIADADARAASGFHPYAHLWDNQSDAVAGLDQAMAVRKKGMEQFSEEAITNFTPLAKLEDVLVPLYNYHRYQYEAVTKLIGGMNYNYSVRGDANQIKPTILSNAIQQKALDAAVNCLSATTLIIPERILQLIPPRPPMYYGIGELFDKRTGMSFDALAAAEALSDFELGFLFNVERANRLVQNKARANAIGFDNVVDAVLKNTWYTNIPNGLEGSIHSQTQQLVLTWLMGVGQSTEANYEVRAICNDRIKELKAKLTTWVKTDTAHKAHYAYALERINNPKDITLPSPTTMAPGAPIGCDLD